MTGGKGGPCPPVTGSRHLSIEVRARGVCPRPGGFANKQADLGGPDLEERPNPDGLFSIYAARDIHLRPHHAPSSLGRAKPAVNGRCVADCSEPRVPPPWFPVESEMDERSYQHNITAALDSAPNR